VSVPGGRCGHRGRRALFPKGGTESSRRRWKIRQSVRASRLFLQKALENGGFESL